MVGSAHLISLGQANGTTGRVEPLYQFTFMVSGKTFTRSFGGDEELLDFLTEAAALRSDVVERVMYELQTSGRANVGELNLSENSAAELGLDQVGSDL